MESKKDHSEGGATGQLINNSKDYIENHVDKDLHQALSDEGLIYSPNKDCFTERAGSPCESDDLFSRQQRFAKALQEYEEKVNPKYRTGFNLETRYTWDDVIARVEEAREQYEGAGKKGKKYILLSIRHRLRGFSKAAPAVQEWLKLLPGDSIYASVLCGGLGLILGAAVRLGQLREDTFETIDQIPALIAKSEDMVRTYGANMEMHVIELYKAILDVLQHIVCWYEGKAGVKFFASLCKGPAYANTLRARMEVVKKASGIIDDAAGMGIHQRLKDIHEVASNTQEQAEELQKEQQELKSLTLEALNHLYKVLRDADLREEFLQKNASKTSNRSSQKGTFARRERDALRQRFGYDRDALMRNVEDALLGMSEFRSSDQDRVAAIIEHDAVQEWLLNLEGQALLVHGNCRRDEIVSPTSAATAMLIRELFDRFSEKTSRVLIMYWFCGLNIHGLDGNILGMLRSFICQLVSGPFTFDIKSHKQVRNEHLKDLLELFLSLLRQLPDGTIVVCFIDGISFYEGDQQQSEVCKVIRQVSSMTKSERVVLKLFMTSPKRTSYLLEDPKIAKRVEVVEILQHNNAPKQGFMGI